VAAGILSGQSSQKRESTALRLDIQGLRALAVLLVVVFHLWPAGVSGGYIGVDVFFVISGYLPLFVVSACRLSGLAHHGGAHGRRRSDRSA